MKLTQSGISLDLPPGWDGRIFRTAPMQPRTVGAQTPSSPPIVHAASFPLPPQRGDFGSGAVEIMRDDDVLVVLIEYAAVDAGRPLFAQQGVPRRLDLTEFSPNNLQRALPGQAGAQRFFSHGGRPFCLYIVLGSYRDRAALVDRVNAVLANLEIGG